MNSIRKRIEDKKNNVIDKARLTLRHNKTKGKMLIIVEGPDDKDFYKPFFKRSHSFIFVADGCENLLGVLNKIEAKYQTKIIAIKDADFDHLNHTIYRISNLFETDFHDYEMFIISPENTANIAKDFKLDDSDARSIHNKVLTAIMNYSYLKWLNSRRIKGENGVNFKRSKVDHHCGKTMDESVDLLNSVPENSDTQIDITKVIELINDNPNPDWRQLHNGHDYCQVVAKTIKNFRPQNIKKNLIPKKLRELYSLEEFSKTRLYQNIREYLSKHRHFSPNMVLK